MDGLIFETKNWTVWDWYLCWLLFWTILLLVLNLMKAFNIKKYVAEYSASKSYSSNAVSSAFRKVLVRKVLVRKVMIPYFIAIVRFHLLFVAFWVAYFLTNLLPLSGIIRWIGVIILFFIILFCLLKTIGHVGSKDLSGKRLIKEFVLAVVGFIILFLSLL